MAIRDKTKTKAGTDKRKTQKPKTVKSPAKGVRSSRAGNLAPKASVPKGPLTLEQARAIVAADTRGRAIGGGTPARVAAGPHGAVGGRRVVEEMTVGSVAAERRKLAIKQRHEMNRDVREYTATLKLLKQHGVKGLGDTVTRDVSRGVRASAARKTAPLQILAEGDSWFKYPPLGHGGIISRLEKRLGVPILNLATPGDEARFMLGVEQRKILAKHLSKGCPAGGPWDVMLFSGGGNDVVDNPMALWVKNYDATVPIPKLINQARFDAVLQLVRAAYEDLIEIRDTSSPGTHLVLHGYDFAIPYGKGVCFRGPWLQPTFELRKFPSEQAGFDVLKVMLQQFAALLQSFVGPTVTFINTQGTLAPVKQSWHNELHPSDDGYNTFADMFHAKLKQMFPARIV